MCLKFVLTRIALAILVSFTITGCDWPASTGQEPVQKKYLPVSLDESITGNDVVTGKCVIDQDTGLMWQVKSPSTGINYWKNTYTWYDPAESSGPELDYRGMENGGECSGSACDTWAYTNAVNKAGLCGYHDWRVPSRDALASISDYSKAGSQPTTDLDFFPYTQAGEYWSGNDYHFQWDSAWAWNYQFGHDRVDWKKSPKYLRLVRGTATQLARVKD